MSIDYSVTAPAFTMDVTTEAPPEQGVVPDLVAAMGRAAESYLRGHPEADAYALRLVAVPILTDAGE